jgi:quercetin dioxygenase-like cupin family protein
MSISKISVLEEAKNLTQPFLVVDLAEIDDFAARLFVSQGMVAWHKHVDQEQLFLVLDGELILESEWGNTALRSGEIAVIPKAVGHRCGSTARTVALVFERRFFSNRQNGQRRMFVLEGAGELKPVSISAEAMTLEANCVSRRLTTVDELVLSVARCKGEAKERVPGHHSELLLVQENSLTLETSAEAVALGRGEMAVVPQGVPYRARASETAVVLMASKGSLA